MATGVIRQSKCCFENFFFSGMAVLILATVFVGFARSYYLAGVFKAPLPSVVIHIHAAAFSSWILLLLAQTSLVAAVRVDLPRRLGLLGFGLACLLVIVGLLAATDSLARHFAAGGSGLGARAFYAIPITDMLIFSTLIYFAFRQRFNPAAHKRLMLIATITPLDAAFGRWPIPCGVVGSPSGADVLLCVAVVAGRVRLMVHRKGSARHALCQPFPDCAATGGGSNQAKRPLAEFRHTRAESCPFVSLSARDNWPVRLAVLSGHWRTEAELETARPQSSLLVRGLDSSACLFTLSISLLISPTMGLYTLHTDSHFIHLV